MPNLTRLDRMIADRGPLLDKIGKSITFALYLNQFVFAVCKLIDIIPIDNKVQGCRVLPDSQTEVQSAMSEAINDYNTTGNYHNIYDIGVASEIISLWSFLVITLLMQACTLGRDHRAFRTSLMKAFWPVFHIPIIFSFFDKLWYQNITEDRGYLYGFVMSCMNNGTMPGCHDDTVAGIIIRENTEYLKRTVDSCVYTPYQPGVIINYTSLTLMYLTLIAGIVIGQLQSRLHPSRLTVINFQSSEESNRNLENARSNLTIIKSCLRSGHRPIPKSEKNLFKRNKAKIKKEEFPQYFCPITRRLFYMPVKMSYLYNGRRYERHFERKALSNWWKTLIGNNRRINRLHDDISSITRYPTDPSNNLNLAEVSELQVRVEYAFRNQIIRKMREIEAQSRPTPFYENTLATAAASNMALPNETSLPPV
jgi:hypothetical protein